MQQCFEMQLDLFFLSQSLLGTGRQSVVVKQGGHLVKVLLCVNINDSCNIPLLPETFFMQVYVSERWPVLFCPVNTGRHKAARSMSTPLADTAEKGVSALNT